MAATEPHAAITPDDVAASMQRGDGGFGRAQTSYFDHPVLQKAHWRWEIVGYFFIGGAAAASAGLATLADLAGDPQDAPLVRNGRYAALVGAALSGALLVKDLGRPERFLNMMRIVKLKSPMSVGVYALSAFSACVGVSASRQARADGLIPVDPVGWIPRAALAPLQIVSAALMASYTGVLLSATAIPVWYRGRRYLPAIFVLSATTSGCALQNALLAPAGRAPRTAHKLEVLESVAGAAEAAMLLGYARAAGKAGAPLFRGSRGRQLSAWTLGAGIGVPLLLGLPGMLRRSERPHRLRRLLAAACALAGGYVLRRCVVEAGRDSADDPRAVLRRPE